MATKAKTNITKVGNTYSEVKAGNGFNPKNVPYFENSDKFNTAIAHR